MSKVRLLTKRAKFHTSNTIINPLNAELNPICHLLALLGAHHILHVSRIRVKEHGTTRTGCNVPFKPQLGVTQCQHH
jgi:hypothetical protein